MNYFSRYLKIVPGILFLAPSLLSCNRKLEERPNLLLVFPDQMRGGALGFLGREPAITPKLDVFASESLVLANAVSNYPVSSPFRAMLLTGKYPVANGVISNCTSRTGKFNVNLRETDTTWSDILKSEGYSLGYIGKWHLESPYEPFIDCSNNKGEVAWNEWTPPERRHGFSFWYAYNTYDQHNRPMYWSTTATRQEFQYVNQWGPEHEAEMAIRFINNEDGKYREKGKPWALVVSMNPPHMPYNMVPEKYVRMYDTVPDERMFSFPNIPPADSIWGKYNRQNARNQYAQITGVDDNFGRILEALKNAGADKNTIVIFTSDHGDCLGRHNEISKNNHYEESMVIPFIIRWPGHIKPSKDDLLLSVPDIYPSLLCLMGMQDKIPSGVQGNDYSGVFLTGKGERPSSQLYIWMPYDDASGGRRGVRTDRYTLMINNRAAGDNKYYLYDNVIDPYQLNNIAGDSPEKINLLRIELRKWLNATNDQWKE
jgi:arylsulfatase A-like enzyme